MIDNSENFTAHPDIAELSNGAFRLHVGALDYCDRHATGTVGRDGGILPAVLVPTLMPRYRRAYFTELVASGLWTVDGDQVEVRES